MGEPPQPELQPLATFETPQSGSPSDPLTVLGSPRCFALVSGPSPFVVKVEAWLRFAGIPFAREAVTPRSMPKGKIPCLRHGEALIPDSTFILKYLERTYADTLYEPPSALRRPTPGQTALAVALSRLVEEQLAPIFGFFRWVLCDQDTARRLVAGVVGDVPEAMMRQGRVTIQDAYIKRGLAAHSRRDLLVLAQDGADALAELLGDQPYLTGEAPCAADASLFGLLDNVFYDTVCAADFKALFERHANLRAFTDRIRGRYFAAELEEAGSSRERIE